MILSGLLIGFAALALIVFGFVAYVIVSSRQTDRYLLSIAGQDRALLGLAADVSPAEWEQALLAVGRGGRWLTPSARRQVRAHLRASLGLRLSRQAVKTWRKRHADTPSAGVFAVHRQLNAFALTELIADVGAYNSLSATSRRWLEGLPPDAHLTRDLQREFHAHTPSDTAGGIRYLGTVNQPLAADIYAINADPLSVMPTTDVVAPHIETAWQRYCRWLIAHAAPCLPDLNPAASDVALAHARAGFMQPLPPEVAALYLQHNGQSSEGIACFPDGHWLPLNEAVQIWQQCRREIPEVWQADWVPIAYSDGHAYIVVDARGEVLDVYLEGNTVALVAPSLAAWLDALAAEAERGGLVFDAVNQTLIVPESTVR